MELIEDFGQITAVLTNTRLHENVLSLHIPFGDRERNPVLQFLEVQLPKKQSDILEMVNLNTSL